MSPEAQGTDGERVVLVVDDVPDNLAVLHDALDESGYTVLVATHGESALQKARQAQPDLILLDAVMPGMDGFAVARALKADATTQHIPIVFMTGLTESEHVVAAFAAGGTDYVTKPIRTPEVMVRIATHMRVARQMRQARSALDAFGHATLAVRPETRRIVWATPLARTLLQTYCPDAPADALPTPLLQWAQSALAARREPALGREPGTMPPLSLHRDGRRLVVDFHERSGDAEWLFVLREESDEALLASLAAAFGLTAREAEVLLWVVRGKTSPDIAEILGNSPRTINKHLEHVFVKMGVETRTAAASLAMQRVRNLQQ
jgi:CheY-like chemotaxis protein/DNA-binding CsgD family transcriptional regulator